MNKRDLVLGVTKGDRKDISKAITVLEDDLPGARELYAQIYSRGGGSFVLGIAGPPGAGKSTLINCLIRELRLRGHKVGVVAVDPTSPFTGGALLGDRIRMTDHSLDEGVYIRSMASRGSRGGLSRSARKAIEVLDAAKYDMILLESVGIGQTEVDIVKVADATLVVIMPEMGDSVQAMKAGLMEIGDVFVVNKADLDGADRAALEIGQFARSKDGGRPLVVKTVAKTCQGVPELASAVEGLMSRTKRRGGRDRSAVEEEVREAVYTKIDRAFAEGVASKAGWAELMKKVAERKVDPDSAAEALIREMTGDVGRHVKKGRRRS
ncbi:MAG TPA: methylmalonyl Co-A mutase-associated GTPase MeaB [Conexivisphaerales archaeon]|nr:methylmalonyl Co-A mutase-associated GTPase MeaB [Conexivisphaerales archaeon]